MNEDKYKKIIGSIVKNQREKLKLTQEKLSERIGLDQSNLSNIENGKNYPSFITFCALVEALKLEPNNFLNFLKFGKNTKEMLDIEIEQELKRCPKEIKILILKLLKQINS